MFSAGIDMGSKTVKVVILRDGKMIGKAMALAGFESREAAEKAFDEAIKQAGIAKDDVQHIVATGAGRKNAPQTKRDITEVGGDAKGAISLYPKARTVIDVGAEEGRAIRCNEEGKVLDFALNEKCAAGAGAFTEAMGRALEVDVAELGRMSLKSKNAIPMNAQCAVFAESEVVSLIHSGVTKPDISKAVHDAIADRITSMVRKVGFESDVVLIGGVSKNPAFVVTIKRNLQTDVVVLPDPEFVGALGAAIVAAENEGVK